MIGVTVARLRKVVNRKSKVSENTFYRYDLTIPNKTIKELHWDNGGLELDFEIIKDSLLIKKSKKK